MIDASQKTDRELLLETHLDVKWLKENNSKQDERLHSLESKVNYGGGFLACILLWLGINK